MNEFCSNNNNNTALRPFTAGTFRIKQFIREHDLTNMLHIYMWLLRMYAILAGMNASLVTGQRNGQSFKKMAADGAKEPLQSNWFRAAMRLYNALTQSNSSTARKILQADM